MTLHTFHLLIILCASTLVAQEAASTKMGRTTKEELQMQVYEKDSLANAVVLYEHANVYIDERHDYDFRTDYYFRIKVFNKDAFDKATIQIPLYKKQKVIAIEAVTYNLEGNFIKKTHLLKGDIFSIQQGEYWKETRFTLPNLKEGSVIEYTYSIINPYTDFDDWEFQSDIPKIKSEYDATILGNYKYNARLISYKDLDKKEISSKEDCVRVDGLGTGGCLVYAFGMNDIPAFKEEDHMLSKKNYMGRVIFDFISFTDPRGGKRKYAKTWEDVDNTLKTYFLDKQTTKEHFFKKKLPVDILNIDNSLEKAKSVYKHIQGQLYWNENYWTPGKLNIKDTFEEGSGSVDAINLILYNSLQAAGIESYIVASSTRNNGLPTKVYPMTKDFNYILVKAIVDGKTYFLDATNKKLAFGQIPFKCLNGEGRVLDFENGGYWEPLKSNIVSYINLQSELTLEDDETLTGGIKVLKNGYYALSERELLAQNTDDDYLDDFETKHPNIIVNGYEDKHKNTPEKSLSQTFQVSVEIDNDYEVLRINPFIYQRVTQNPFKLKERKYDVDYGYPRTLMTALKLNIPENYSVISIPERKAFLLPNKGGNFTLNVSHQNNSIFIYSKFHLFKKTYSADEYHYLKAFYNEIIKAQNGIIKLKKNN